jgi:hypothetical protein
MSKNPLLDLAALAAFAYWGYLLGRMLWRREAFVRDGWTKWTWEPASRYPGSYIYGIVMTSLLMIFSTLLIYADFKGWLR